MSPVHNIIATALSHSVGANLAFLNLQNVEKVRDSALAVGVERSFLSKANILTALLEACEDSFVDTSRPAVVVIDDAPLWLLSNEAASEVVVEELKSVSSRVVFLAISPPDVLKSGDFSPSARPAPLPPQTSENAEISADALSNNPLASFANLFNAGNGGGGGPDSSSRTGNRLILSYQFFRRSKDLSTIICISFGLCSLFLVPPAAYNVYVCLYNLTVSCCICRYRHLWQQ